MLREIRAVYDPFTAKHCPTCETPCCIRPSRVTPLDVIIAVGCGHSFPHLGAIDPVDIAAEHAEQRLDPSAVKLTVVDELSHDLPCEFIERGRCTFPDDLRPHGCAAYICNPMHRHMPDADMRKLKRLVRLLGDAHDALLRAVGDGQGSEIETAPA